MWLIHISQMRDLDRPGETQTYLHGAFGKYNVAQGFTEVAGKCYARWQEHLPTPPPPAGTLLRGETLEKRNRKLPICLQLYFKLTRCLNERF